MDLKVVYATLAEVAGLEERLASARDARDRHARRDDHLGALGRELAADADEARQAVDQAGSALRRLDRELADVAQGLATRRERLAGVADQRQALAVRQEVAALERRQADLEAQALGLLGTLERAESVAAGAADDAVRQSVRSRDELARLASAADRGASAVAAAEEELQRVLALLPPDLARHLRRLQARDGHGVAVARDGVCGGCFEALPATLAGDVARRRAIVRCAGCGRIVI